jgi:hypothetical protein
MRPSGLMIVVPWMFWIAFGGTQNDSVDILKKALNGGSYESFFDLVPIAIDAGPSAVPYLKQMLSSKDPKKKINAAELLAYIGGEEAIEALQDAQEAGSREFDWALCSAVASRGNRSDIMFLINAMNPNHPHSQDFSPTAIYSLGILRAKEAIPALERETKREAGDIRADAAKDVLNWIRGKPVSVRAEELSTPDRDIISAIFVNGIPRTRIFKQLKDRERNAFWIRKKNLWEFRKDHKGDGFPAISFDIHLSPDESRALVIVDVVWVPGSSTKYNFILQKTESTWKLRSITLIGGS